jgi:WD40 repeat protein
VELAWLRQQAVQTVGNHDVPDAESAHQSLKAACKPASAFPSTLAHIAPSVSHSSRIWDVGSSPDGSMVISAAGDGCLRLFDVRTAREASQRRVAHMRECIDSDSGQWDAADGWDSVVPLAHRSHFCDLQSADASSGPCDMYATTFHPGGRHIVGAGFDRKVRVWDVETGTCLHTLSGHVGAVHSFW